MIPICRLVVMTLLRAQGEACATDLNHHIATISHQHNSGVRPCSSAASIRILRLLEAQKLAHSWASWGPNTRGVPQRVYALTLEGEALLDRQLKILQVVGLVQEVC